MRDDVFEDYHGLDKDGSLCDCAECVKNCPTCDSPDPKLHPAVQHEGEVSVCSDAWHGNNDR